jgi:hypothetical protein
VGDVLFRESRATFFMGAIMGDLTSAYWSATRDGEELEHDHKRKLAVDRSG